MIELLDLYPQREGEDGFAYAQRLAEEGRARGILRQCSIGWHNECSCARYGYTDCKCECHPFNHTNPAA